MRHNEMATYNHNEMATYNQIVIPYDIHSIAGFFLHTKQALPTTCLN